MPMSIALLYLRLFVLSMVLTALRARYRANMREKRRKTAKNENFRDIVINKLTVSTKLYFNTKISLQPYYFSDIIKIY